MVPHFIVQCSKDTRATSAVEFAIVAPVFILIMFGIVAYGIFFGAANSVQQLAADAARASIAGLGEDERIQLAQRFIDLNTANYPLLQSRKVKVRVAGSAADANQFDVSVEYDATQLPIWNLYVPLPLPEKTITRSATIRVGGV
ncbi:MAG: pilus assembly protein [Rhodobiaceae bacterium]|nr:pilus assembly protein [Rhodobiaceae bacterium]